MFWQCAIFVCLFIAVVVVDFLLVILFERGEILKQENVTCKIRID
jgi:hypothetical protein